MEIFKFNNEIIQLSIRTSASTLESSVPTFALKLLNSEIKSMIDRLSCF